MFFSLLVLLVGLVVSGLTVIYVSYPRRGQEVPRVPWLGEAIQRGVDALPTLDLLDPADAEGSLETVEKSLARVE